MFFNFGSCFDADEMLAISSNFKFVPQTWLAILCSGSQKVPRKSFSALHDDIQVPGACMGNIRAKSKDASSMLIYHLTLNFAASITGYITS